ncbi:MAG: acetyl-CoA carboxylase biotin carboxyl carrier protein [Limisphaerales bacterium]|jgi:acetyl-CoA carboxylase biotin carboxyl carrier protein
MDYKEIQDLIKMVNRSNLAELSIEQKDFKIKLRTVDGVTAKGPGSTTTHVVAPISPMAGGPAPQPGASPAPSAEAAPEAAEKAEENPSHVTINSPMVGTFYRSSTPESEPFVKPGDMITEGQVLCVVEAMKLFNEIEAEITGMVVKVLCDDASPVEYDQPLFIIDPKG